MVQDFVMNKANLVSFIKKCKKFNTTRHNADYAYEIGKVLKVMDDNPNKAWNNLIYSKVFYLAVGMVLNIHGNYVTVEA